MAKYPVEKWIEEAVKDPEKGNASGFALCHCEGAMRKEVHSIKFGGQIQWTVKDLAKVFNSKAEEFAEPLAGSQLFELQVFYGRDESEGTKNFRVTGALNLDGLGTEGPSEKGMLHQGMRHLEAATKMVFEKDALLFNTMSGVIKTLSDNYREATTELKDATKIVHELVQEKITADDERERKRLEYERSTAERSKWIGMVPPLANQLTGREIFPTETAKAALLDSIGDSLDESQIAALAGILKPEQMALLSGIMADRVKRLNEKNRQGGNNGQ